MKKILLTQNKYALVDNSDYLELSKYKWTYSKGYAVRMEKAPYETGKRRMIYMQHEILGRKLVDHISGDGTDNRRTNLRVATLSENMRNRKIAKNNKSGYKGVVFRKDRNTWVAYIKLGHSRVIAHCKTAEEAAHIYDQVSLQLWGDFARPNFEY